VTCRCEVAADARAFNHCSNARRSFAPAEEQHYDAALAFARAGVLTAMVDG